MILIETMLASALVTTSPALLRADGPPHEHHFHLTFAVPGVQSITIPPRALMAEEALPQLTQMPQEVSGEEASAMQDMLLALSLPKADKVVKSCRIYNARWEDPNTNTLTPGWEAQEEMGGQQRESKGETVKQWVDRLMREWAVAKVSVVEPPLHGRYREGTSGLAPNGNHMYLYIPPSKDFHGQDRWSFLVEFKNGKRTLIRYQMNPGEPEDNSNPDMCKMNLLASWPSELQMALNTGTNNLPAWQTQSQLGALLAGNIASATQGFTRTASPKSPIDKSNTSTTEFSSEMVADYATNPMMLVAQKNTNNKPFNVVLDSCMRAERGKATIDPLFDIKSYLSGIKKSHIGYIPNAKVTIIRQSEFGTLEPYKLPSSGETIFMYKAFDKEWLGKDRAEFLVEHQGKTYKVIQRIEMVVDAELSDKPYEKYYSGPCDSRTHRIAIQSEVIEASISNRWRVPDGLHHPY